MVECSYCQEQTVRHIVEECSLSKFTSVEKIHTVNADAIEWMDKLCVCL